MENEKSEDCDACHFATTELKGFEVGYGDSKRKMWFCDLCSATHSSSSVIYPNQWPNKNDYIIQTVCFVGNTILQELRKQK